jgi:hypothetical protein
MTKQKLLAMSIAAVLSGGIGNTHASETVYDSGVGHQLILPYFSTQNGNATLINLTNTDQTNGKAVKVRFRSGVDSDNIFDFQVFLSPGDVWSAAITQGADGRAQLSTTDKSCTLPASVNQSFTTTRLASYTWPDAVIHDINEQTREGYVEVINMADIPQYLDDPATAGYSASTNVNPLYTAIKHVSGVAPCTQATLLGIEAAGGEVTAPIAGGLGASSYTGSQQVIAPTTGLMGHWVIINVPRTLTFSGPFAAIKASGQTMVVYAGQTSGARAATHAAASRFISYPSFVAVANNIFPYLRLTEDGVLLNQAQTGVVTTDNDFPDLSTPYEPGVTLLPGTQAANLSQAMLRENVVNEFLTDPAVNAGTDWVISMPTRRYHVSGRGANYGAASDGKGYPATESIDGIAGGVTFAFYQLSQFNQLNQLGQIRGAFAANGRSSCIDTDVRPKYYDREDTPSPSGGVVITGLPLTYSLCGGANVLSWNNSGSTSSTLGAMLILDNWDNWDNWDYGNVSDGWATVQMDLGGGLPVLGSAFIKAYNASANTGVSGNYGAVFPHSY